MTFGFEFKLPELIYYVMGYETEKETKSNLEKISISHCGTNDMAIGTIYFYDSGIKKRSVLKRYEIRLVNGNLVMETI